MNPYIFGLEWNQETWYSVPGLKIRKGEKNIYGWCHHLQSCHSSWAQNHKPCILDNGCKLEWVATGDQCIYSYTSCTRCRLISGISSIMAWWILEKLILEAGSLWCASVCWSASTPSKPKCVRIHRGKFEEFLNCSNPWGKTSMMRETGKVPQWV